jgi:hypothetical protein
VPVGVVEAVEDATVATACTEVPTGAFVIGLPPLLYTTAVIVGVSAAAARLTSPANPAKVATPLTPARAILDFSVIIRVILIFNWYPIRV